MGRVVAGIIFLVSAFPLLDTLGLLGSTVRDDVWIVSLGLLFAIQYGTRSATIPPAAGGSRTGCG